MNQGNWKAWVDNMPTTSDKRPLLHVHGDIQVNDKAKRDLYKHYPGSENPNICLLEVKPEASEGNVDCHLKYHEELDDSNQYSQVQIILSSGNTVTIDVEQVWLNAQQATASEAEKSV